MTTPEAKARATIDRLLDQAGWKVCDLDTVNLSASRGIAVREFPLAAGHGFADYLLYVDGKAVGVIEAKPEGTTLTGVEVQSAKYARGLPDNLPAWSRPLPFAYESTGVETQFTNGLDPEPRSRATFSFHRPETLADWLDHGREEPIPMPPNRIADPGVPYRKRGRTFLARIRRMPLLQEEGLWPAQTVAIKNLEQSLAENRPRALIQMATGSGKTFTAISFIYRLIKFAGARRVLFLVDRGNLGKQTLKEFRQYVSPYHNLKFTEEYIVQRLASKTLDTTARVCISTIQRLYSMLKGTELSEEEDEQSVERLEKVFKDILPIEYNPAIPIETFDVIVTDECHRSIYNLWRQVLEYFDAGIIGLTATPGKQTFGFFNRNLVMEYNHEQAVADGVNVNYDVYRIRTAITEQGSKIDAGFYIDKRDRESRKVRWEQLSDDFAYDPDRLDRDVVAVDQIRTVIRTFRDKLFTEIFPGRTEVPKTLIFAKDDSHAEDIVKIVREEFAKGNEFAQKITYRTTGAKTEDLISSFRNSFNPRIAVTVDMIATGTDIKPLEIVMFMRAVKSRTFFEQMKGRGVRVIEADDLRSVTPDATAKDRFVIVDAVGVCEQDKTDSRPMDQKKSVSFEKLIQAVALGNRESVVISSIAARLARLERHLTPDDRREVEQRSGGKSVKQMASDLVASIDPDQPKADAEKAIQQAVAPLHRPELRNLLVELKRKSEQTIDHVSQDQIIEASFSADATEKARATTASFERFIAEHKDEIVALQVLYGKPYRARLRFEDIKELAEIIKRPPRQWTEEKLWQSYAALEKSKVRGASAPRLLTDLVSLVRFALHRENELVPFPDRVQANFERWIAGQKPFTAEQRQWLAMIRDHVAGNLAIGADDFEYSPFAQQGGLGKAHQLFGPDLAKILDDLNNTLAA